MEESLFLKGAKLETCRPNREINAVCACSVPGWGSTWEQCCVESIFFSCIPPSLGEEGCNLTCSFTSHRRVIGLVV